MGMGMKWGGDKVGTEQSGNKFGTSWPKWDKNENKVIRLQKWDKNWNKGGKRIPNWDKNEKEKSRNKVGTKN